MRIAVNVVTNDPERPPVGSPVRVELRDTTYADAPARTIDAVTGVVREGDGPALATVELNADSLPQSTTIWAHVDVHDTGRVEKGDFITKASYPAIESDGEPVTVSVSQV